MTIRRNPRQGDQEAREAFRDQAGIEDTTRLHCFIPSELHHRLKVVALEERTNVKALVVKALQDFVDKQR